MVILGSLSMLMIIDLVKLWLN
ncbi:hypothetical protein Gorai_022930 [Gossypium raimondii]|uniref:Uncharacterized protein n=1 Tax=Gossypium raimondii TaxID=29730 RepID=A0A7J8NV64_GOSRA|nr:hypothetical protein [Gossypium raimondii]